MCCSRSSRTWYLLIVSLWLLLTVIRQILDSIGRLWIPMVFNSFQIFSCICGLIAIIHWQKRLFVVFILLNFTFILYNIALILWYNEYFSISRDIPILGIGFPHSYSFFLRYTPSCKSYYDLINFHWVQLPCIVPYHYIESTQALLHIFIANLSIILSIVLFPKRSCDKIIEKRINDMVTDGELRINQFKSDEMNNNKEYNQKYSKEILNLTGQEANEQQYARPENGYIRHSAKNSSRKYYKETIAANQNSNNFQKPFIIKRSQSMTDLKNECREVEQTYIEESNELISNGLTNMIPKSKRSQIAAEKKTRTANSGCVCRTGSLKNFTLPTTEGVRRILSHEEIDLVNNFRTNNAVINSTNGNLKSLVSFDPKSNVLLRIHNHIDDNDDDDDIYRHLQQQQQYRIPKQVKISFIKTKEQMQHRNSKYPLTNDSLVNCQSNEPIFGFSDTSKNRCYDLTSFRQNCNRMLTNSSRQQLIWYSKCGDDIMFDETEQCNVKEPSTIDHPKSQIISSTPILNSNDFLV